MRAVSLLRRLLGPRRVLQSAMRLRGGMEVSKPAADLARPNLLLKLLTSLPACGACSPSQRLRLLLQTLPFGLLIERLMLQWDVQLPRRLHGRVVLAAHQKAVADSAGAHESTEHCFKVSLARLPSYMLTCLHAYMLTCLHAYLLTCLHAYMPTCSHAYMLSMAHCFNVSLARSPARPSHRITHTVVRGQCAYSL